MLEGWAWDVQRLLGAETVGDYVCLLDQNGGCRGEAIESGEGAGGDGEGTAAGKDAAGDNTDDNRADEDADGAQCRPRALIDAHGPLPPPPRPTKLWHQVRP